MSKKGNGKKDDEFYESMEDAIIGELRAFKAAGINHEQHRALVKPRVKDWNENAYGELMAELSDRGVLDEGMDGPGTIAIAQLVREAKAAASQTTDVGETEDATEEDEDTDRAAVELLDAAAPNAEKPLDSLPVLAALQAAGEKGATVEELQQEIEAAGGGRHPRGVVLAVATELVKAGNARAEGGSESDTRFWLAAPEDPKVVLERRAKLLIALSDAYGDDLKVVTLQDAINLGATPGDVRALKAAKLIEDSEESDLEDPEDEPDYAFELTERATDEMIRMGAVALAMLTVEVPTSGDGVSGVAPVDNELADSLRADLLLERQIASNQASRIRELEAWFVDKGMVVPGKEPPAPSTPKAKRYVIAVKIDDAERGRIFREVAAKRVKLNALNNEKSSIGNRIKDLTAEVDALFETGNNEMFRDVMVYDDPDLANRKILVRADNDDRVVSEKPIAAPPDAESTPVPETADPPADNGVRLTKADAATAQALATAPLVIVDVSALEPLERDAYQAISKADRIVSRADLPSEVQESTGKPVGPSIKAKLVAAADSLAEKGIVVRDGDAYRALGAPAVAAPAKTPKDRVWAAIGPDFTLIGEIKRAAGVADDEFKEAIDDFKKAGRIATDGRGVGTKYKRAGSAPTEARV